MIRHRTLSLIFISLLYDLSSCLECRRKLRVEEYIPVSHECERPCEFPANPKTCQYKLKAEWVYSMAAECIDCPLTLDDCYREDCITTDGSSRPVVSTNTQLPGPSIQVCHGDTVQVRLVNNLVDNGGLTIHWYGMHQVGTNWMDGASMITQCSVASAGSFVYEFVANPAGTHWWHGNSGLERNDGMFGSLIVRKPMELERNGNLYDVDDWSHTINVIDWRSRPTLAFAMDSLSPSKYIYNVDETMSLLVNGRASEVPITTVSNTNVTTLTPLSVFEVQHGLAHRFRLISAVSGLCNLHVVVESHPMTIIAIDGSDVMPIEVDSFIIAPGERVDFVLKAVAKPSTYCIYFRGTATSNCTNDGVATLVYKNAEPVDSRLRQCTHSYDSKGTSFSISDTYALEPLDQRMHKADEKYIVTLSSRVTDIVSSDGRVAPVKLKSFQINNVKFSYPPSSFYDTTPVKTCSSNNEEILGDGTCSSDSECSCTQVLKLKKGQVVDLFIINHDCVSHSMHLHGHSFRVLSLGININNLQVENMDVSPIPPEAAVIKDTVDLPAHGYAVIRTMFDNLGYWMFHDQINSYLERGMAMVVQVGEDSEIPKPPPTFPTCGAWSPD